MSMKELFNNRLAIKPEGISDAERTAVLSGLFNYVSHHKQQFMGFQDNMMLSFPDVHQFMQLSLNNVGDPFVECSNANNTKAVEVHVLDYFARLWNVKYPHDPNDPESYWGYLLCMGSTEGNLYGLWQAREYLLGNTTYVEKNDTHKVLFNNINGQYSSQSKMPIAFFSEACHYSIIKGCRMLSIPLFCEIGRQYYKNENPLGGEWPDAVPCDEHGAVDGSKLIRIVEFFASKGHPPIIVMNYGTTFTGNYDNVEKIGAELMPILAKYNMEDRELVFEHKTETRKGYWFHVDAALGGSYSNYLRNAQKKGKFSGPVPPKFDFSNKWVHSICASGHKWIGSPWPCGIFLTRVGFHLPPNGSSMYIGCPDSTLSGSRNGTTALVMWDFFSKNSEDALENRIIKNMQDAEYATAQLLKLSYELGAKHAIEEEKERQSEDGWAWASPDAPASLSVRLKRPNSFIEEERKQFEDRNNWLWVARAPASLSIRFKRPNPAIVKMFSLSAQNTVEDIPGVGKVTKELCHIYVMHHVDRNLIDVLIQHLREPGAYDLST